ncbi:MAG: radical SAM family heme chaperone HemW [Clostridia bacterium]|nr:radical SAM family heme chaperone HemW [Clostridia bacterium]
MAENEHGMLPGEESGEPETLEPLSEEEARLLESDRGIQEAVDAAFDTALGESDSYESPVIPDISQMMDELDSTRSDGEPSAEPAERLEAMIREIPLDETALPEDAVLQEPGDRLDAMIREIPLDLELPEEPAPAAAEDRLDAMIREIPLDPELPEEPAPAVAEDRLDAMIREIPLDSELPDESASAADEDRLDAMIREIPLDEEGSERTIPQAPASGTNPASDNDLPNEGSESEEGAEEEPQLSEKTAPEAKDVLPVSEKASEGGKEEASERKVREPSEKPETDYRKLGLYLHVPFCRSKCAYCDFYSTDRVVCKGFHVPSEMKSYCQALKNQMKFFSERTTQYNVDTVFIGGGTPTSLPAHLLLDLVKEVSRDFYMEDGFEFTVEMNPSTAEAGMLKRLRKAGVNRLSIGLQSAQNNELAALSRTHTLGDFSASFQMAREAGFDNINIDLMYGIPEQTQESFAESLEFACNMKPEHISMYNLRIEDGTPFGKKKQMLPLPDEDAECAMYFNGINYLKEHGYHQYEISNFARPGRECRHNLRYWRGEEYIGCGSGAHSYFGGRRFSIRPSLEEFASLLRTVPKTMPAALQGENYSVDDQEQLVEYLMLRFRLAEGVSANDFRARFGVDFEELLGTLLEPYRKDGYVIRTDEPGDVRYAFSPKGMFVSNFILARILPSEPRHDPSFHLSVDES